MQLEQLLARAERPMFILGGSRWDAAAREAMTRFAERFDVPVATSYRRLPLFDPLHRCYAGDLGLGPNPKLIARIKAADVVVLVGGRLGEWATGSTDRVAVLPVNQQVNALATPQEPVLLLYDAGLLGPSVQPTLGPWQTQLTVLRQLTSYGLP